MAVVQAEIQEAVGGREKKNWQLGAPQCHESASFFPKPVCNRKEDLVKILLLTEARLAVSLGLWMLLVCSTAAVVFSAVAVGRRVWCTSGWFSCRSAVCVYLCKEMNVVELNTD